MDQISNYATLQSAMAGMVHRSDDTDITDNAPLFIQLCEADLNDRMLLKDMESEETLTLTTSVNYVALPTGYVSPVALWLVVSGERTLLTKVLPEDLAYSTTNSIPTEYAIDGANIRFDCPASEGFTGYFRMMKKSNLSGSNTSNALLLRRPDIYLYGSLFHLAQFMDDPEGAAKWQGLYEKSIDSLKKADARSRTVPLKGEEAMTRGSILTGTP